MMNLQQKHWKIILIGDSCIDEYIYGTVNRISPEAPIPILDFKQKEIRDGMTLNVYKNLVNLGCDVEIHTSVLEKKTRFIDSKSNQQLLRFDSKLKSDQYKTSTKWSKPYDAIIISDYDKGYLTYNKIEYIIKNSNVPVFIDTKKPDLNRFNNAYVKINNNEYDLSTSKSDKMIVTYGGEKVVYQDRVFYPPKVNAHDVCGAGDTFIAALVKKFLDTNRMDKAIEYAMKAAAVTVKNIGVYAPTIEEIDNET